MHARYFVVVVTLLMTHSLRAADWPQWMGSERDAVWREEGIVDQIPESGLPVLWRVPIAGGYAGPAVAGDRVVVTDYVRRRGEVQNDPGERPQLEGTERVLCFRSRDGKLLWQHEYDCPYQISYPAGPRTTPTIDGDRVYTLGSEGDLLCLDMNDGKVIWSKALKEEYRVEAPIWGFSAHPLVDGDRLFCLVGGEGSVAVALDKHTGRELWRALSASEPGYCPPTMITAAKRRQLLIWDADNLNALDPETGNVFWSVPLKPDYGMSIMAPRRSGDLLFASGIGGVAAVVKLDVESPAAEVIWNASSRKESVYCANSTPLVVDGVIYGADCHEGSLMAVDLETGKRLWTTFAPTTGGRRAGHGTAFLVRQSDRYWIFSETGDLILARLSREGYDEIGRFHVLEPTGEAFGRSVVWSHPAFANRCAYVRNDQELVCVSLARQE